jgi:hypothetical protein
MSSSLLYLAVMMDGELVCCDRHLPNRVSHVVMLCLVVHLINSCVIERRGG